MSSLWTKEIVASPEIGNFKCPSCADQQEYESRYVKRFFCLLSIPILPFRTVEETIKCLSCKNTFNKVVLNSAKSPDNDSNYCSAITKVMISVLLADGVIDDAEITTLQDVYQRVVGKGIDKETVLREIETLKKSGDATTDSLSMIHNKLNSQQKERMIRAAMFIALSDGEFHPDEEHLIEKFGKNLRLKRTKVREIIESVKKYY